MASGEPSSVQGPFVDSSDNDTFQQLLEQIKVMNKNLESATFSLDNLTRQLSSQTTATNILPQISNGNQENNGQAGRYADTSDHSDQATHVLGYVNWDDCCNEFENIHLVKMIYIRNALAKLQNIKPVASYNSYDSYDQQIATRQQVQETVNGLFAFKHSVPVVGKEDRFPQDAVYIDVNSPKIKEEMDFMNKILVPPTQGVFDRFLKIVESEMMTCATFEKKYGLKWV